jgi:hypothetical protein
LLGDFSNNRAGIRNLLKLRFLNHRINKQGNFSSAAKLIKIFGTCSFTAILTKKDKNLF